MAERFKEHEDASDSWVEYKRLVMQLLTDLRSDIRDINGKLEKQTKEILLNFSAQEKLLLDKISKLEDEVSSLKTKVANIYAIGAGFAFASGIIVTLIQYIWSKFAGG